MPFDKLGRLTGAKDLIDGRKIRVTDNIWFIGTANQDESTFEISDKVYDRAQVVSLNRKGVSEGQYANTEKKYISVTDLIKLFEGAINAYKKKAEVEARLEKLDAVLMDKFDISFGNRIVTQTVRFVDPVNIDTENGNAVRLSEVDSNNLIAALKLFGIPGMSQTIREGLQTPRNACLTEEFIRFM